MFQYHQCFCMYVRMYVCNYVCMHVCVHVGMSLTLNCKVKHIFQKHRYFFYV